MEPTEHTELIEVVRAWDESIVANDTLAIGRFMTEDWIIVGPDGSIDGRERFLGLIASGDLMHNAMTSEDLIIRVLGDSAIVVAGASRPGRTEAGRSASMNAHPTSSSVAMDDGSAP